MIKTLYAPFRKWSENGAVYIISDTHFDDSDCKIMNPSWPETCDAIKRINSIVKKNDTLIILGDVGDEKYVKEINAGRKVLIAGNHDKGASKYMRRRMCAEHGTVEDNGLFDEVYTGPLMISDRILLSHEPIYLPFVTNIHGHAHNGVMRYKNEFGCNCLNLASDVCGYEPISLGDEIKSGLLSCTPSIHRLTIDGRYNKENSTLIPSMSEEVCLCCGATIPEGVIICPACETSTIRAYNEYNRMIADGTFIEKFYGVKLRWYQKLLLKII